ncbi:MAG: baseplate J/gp47 family protein [Candidatus Fimivivens sp.]|nr:baseplate J/gp47 family protein [Candidatus Fimivivens sp.]
MSIEIMTFDMQQEYDSTIAAVEKQLGEILNPGDERRIVVGTMISVLGAAVSQANAYANGQLVRYASDNMLDLLGDFVGAERLAAKAASVTLQFTISAAVGATVEIPRGTRATPDGKHYFSTDKAVIAAYDVGTVNVTATATETGAAHNGIAAGGITVIVDPVAYVTAVTNVDISSGGLDAESDDDFRERIRLAPSQYSVAGPVKAYQYWAMSADPGIGDVSVTSPNPARVLITVLMSDGSVPSQTVLDAVLKVVSADTVRPLTDLVSVQAPTEIKYTVAATYYISSADATQAATIQAAVAAAYSNYLSWQSEKLGRAINPDELRRRILSAGAYRVDLTTPTYTEITPVQVARASATSALTYGGLL